MGRPGGLPLGDGDADKHRGHQGDASEGQRKVHVLALVAARAVDLPPDRVALRKEMKGKCGVWLKNSGKIVSKFEFGGSFKKTS